MTAAPPRIAYLTGEYPRVSHTFILREIEALRRLGAEVDTYTIRATPGDQHTGDEEKAAFATTWPVQPNAKRPGVLLRALAAADKKRLFSALKLAIRTRPPGTKAFAYQIFYWLQGAVLAQRLRAAGTQHLHNHFANSSCSTAMLAAEIAGIPFSVTMHGPAIFFEPHWWRIDVKIARAAFTACISHFCRAQGMIFADQAHWDRMKIIHCGVTPGLYAPDPASARAPGKTLLFVGRLAAIKGVSVLLDAMAQLKDAHPDARLVLIGDGGERKALEAKAAALGLSDMVKFAGYRSQPEVAAALQDADVFVLPSFAEGVPVVLMEAMASETPVIAPRVAGVPELVEDGVSGFTVSPGDVDDLAAKIDALLSDPALRADMGRAGRAMVEAEFDVDAEAARMLSLITGAAAGALPEGLRP
jgi:glycosyltransferase involved in cell wall biosynthesis